MAVNPGNMYAIKSHFVKFMYYLPILQINTKPLDGGIITFKLYIFFYSEHIPLLHYIISNKLKPEFKAAFYHEFS